MKMNHLLQKTLSLPESEALRLGPRGLLEVRRDFRMKLHQNHRYHTKSMVRCLKNLKDSGSREKPSFMNHNL